MILTLDHLEERIVPTTINVNAGDVSGLIAAINTANTDSKSGINDTINLNANAQSSSVYAFTAANNTTNGANVLPVITATDLTIQGNGSTLNAASFGRLFDVASGAGLTLENLTLTGGVASGANAQGGAIYNSGGNVVLQSAVVGGNQAIGGASQNGQGGAIYSNGGSLSLSKDILGKKVTNDYNASYVKTKGTTVGASNKASGGSGGAGQGAGLYLVGGTVSITHSTLADNVVSGGSGGNAQGGALYANAATLNLTNDLVGLKVIHHVNSTGKITKHTSIGSANNANGGASGGAAQGAGLYVSGGTLKLTNATISANLGLGGAGASGSVGGNAQGGGIYSNGAALTVSGGSIQNETLRAGSGGSGANGTANKINGGAGGVGGMAQGGGIYAQGGSLAIGNGAIISNQTLFGGGGGVGGAGYAGGVGGAGGAGGSAEGGGIYANLATSFVIDGSSQVNHNAVKSGSGGGGGAGAVGYIGGVGGQGGNAAGGGVYASQAPVQINGGVEVNQNFITAGGGGTGGGGANGGSGGLAQGGGLFAQGGSVTLGSNDQFNSNTVRSGTGGYGGAGVVGASNGGVGGNSGTAEGGGVFASGGNVSMTSLQIELNQVYSSLAASGGAGLVNTAVSGHGGAGGAGGNSGNQIGGGLYVAGSNLTVNLTSVLFNFNSIGPNEAYGGHGGAGGTATGAKGVGGAGGVGGNAGLSEGGGAALFGSNTVTLNGVTMDGNNLAAMGGGTGGNGGNGLMGGAAGNGGDNALMQGGGLFVSGGTLNITNGSQFEKNIVVGQTGGAGGIGGTTTKTTTGGTPGANGAGQAGSAVTGGGIATTGAAVTLNNATLGSNIIYGGEGGTGGGFSITAPGSILSRAANGAVFGANGAGGLAQGGGLYAANGSLTIENGTTITSNAAVAAKGGPVTVPIAGIDYTPGTIGIAQGGGAAIVNMTSPVAFSNSTLDSNLVEYGDPGTALAINHVNGFNGSDGGINRGAGLFVQNSTFNGTTATITNNQIRIGDGGNGGSPNSTKFTKQSGGNGGSGGTGGSAQGGGLYATGSTINLTSSTLTGNSLSVDNGGTAGVGFNGKPNGLAGLGGSGGSGQGAGLFATSTSTVTLLDTSVDNNSMTIGQGGAGLSSTSGQPGGAGGVGGNNSSGQGGGVFANDSTTLKITNSTLAENVLNLDNGGNGGNGTVGGAGGAGGVGTAATSTGTAQGGGLYAAGSTLTLVNDTLAGNAFKVALGGAGGNGSKGAGGNGGAGGVNNGTGQGGGLFLSGGTATLINNTVAANTIGVNQGGAAGTGTTAATAGANGTTITAQAGGLFNDPTNSDSVTLENTIIALNTALNSPNDIAGTIASSDHDFIGDGTGATFTTSNGDQIGTSANPLNPNLGPLANYGGPTLTLLPLSGSPVVGKGDTGALTAIAAAEGTTSANATDQRGYARSVNGLIDIGADELQPGITLSGTVTPTSVQAGGTVTYTFTVTNPGQFAIDGLTLTDTLSPDTTFVSLTAPSGWTTTTPTVGQSGTVTATTSSLAGNASVTFTLVVQVNSNVAGGTTIANTATIAPTQSGAQVGNASLTLNTTVGSSLTNITNEIAVYQSRIFRDFDDGKGSYVQFMALINNSGATITGPVALVITGLPAGVTLTNASGTYNGNPYITLEPSNGSWQTGWWNFLFVVLEFSDPSGAKITYTPQIVQGL